MPALKFGIVAGAFLKKLVPRGGLPVVSIANGLDWQTAARGSFDPQRFSGALANHAPPPLRRIRFSFRKQRALPSPLDPTL
jgi:hypothetical protein